jgi:hypothetical protein
MLRLRSYFDDVLLLPKGPRLTMGINSKPRMSAVEFGRAKALGNLRKAADLAMEGRDNILLEVFNDRPSKLFRVKASYGSAAVGDISPTSIEHPVPWYVPFSVMLEECYQLVRAIETEREDEVERKLSAKRRPKL